MDTAEKDQEPPTPYQAGYAFGDQYRKGSGAMLAELHPASIDYRVSLADATWIGGAEGERLGFSYGTVDGARFKGGFLAALYGRAPDEGPFAELEVPPWLSRRSADGDGD